MSMRSPLMNLFQVASLVLVLLALGLLSAITTMHFAIHGAEVQVPALKGMTVADARSQTSGLGLNLTVDNRYYSSDVAAGHILTQSPPSGTVVRREWRVRVSESLGPQRVEVPETVGMDERMAALKLRRMGLAIGATSRIPMAKAPEGLVLSQDPPAHAQGIEGPSISLLIAIPGEDMPDGFVMPDLTGLPVVSAQALLGQVGLRSAVPDYVDVHVAAVGNGSAAPANPQVPGSVIGQQPGAGSRVDLSAEVKLTVAR